MIILLHLIGAKGGVKLKFSAKKLRVIAWVKLRFNIKFFLNHVFVFVFFGLVYCLL